MPIKIETPEDTRDAIIEIHTMLTEILDHLTGGGGDLEKVKPKRDPVHKRHWPAIEDIMADGQEYHYREVWKHLRVAHPDVQPGHVNGYMNTMERKGKITRVHKGFYRITQKDASGNARQEA